MTYRTVAPATCAALLALAACRGTTAPENVAGSYTLRSIDGASLPVSLKPSSSWHTDVVAGTLELDDKAAFTYSIQVREMADTPTGTTVRTVWVIQTGTYTRKGGALTLAGDGDWRFQATVGGAGITVLDDWDADIGNDQLLFVR